VRSNTTIVAVCVERNGTAGLACCIATPACVKTRCFQEWIGHLEPRFQGEGVVPGEYFLVSTKLR